MYKANFKQELKEKILNDINKINFIEMINL